MVVVMANEGLKRSRGSTIECEKQTTKDSYRGAGAVIEGGGIIVYSRIQLDK
jgi:hypothetical protein